MFVRICEADGIRHNGRCFLSIDGAKVLLFRHITNYLHKKGHYLLLIKNSGQKVAKK